MISRLLLRLVLIKNLLLDFFYEKYDFLNCINTLFFPQIIQRVKILFSETIL